MKNKILKKELISYALSLQSTLFGATLSMVLAGWLSIGAMFYQSHTSSLPTSILNCSRSVLILSSSNSWAENIVLYHKKILNSGQLGLNSFKYPWVIFGFRNDVYTEVGNNNKSFVIDDVYTRGRYNNGDVTTWAPVVDGDRYWKLSHLLQLYYLGI